MSRSRFLSVLLLALVATGLVYLLARDHGPQETDPLETGSDAAAGAQPDPGMLEAGAEGSTQTVERPGDTGSRLRAVTRPVTGSVVDGRERPIPGATVRLFRVDGRGMRGAPYPDQKLQETTADREGSFTFEPPSAATAWMRVVASAPEHATVGLLVASDGAHVTLRLPAAGRLAVDVLDEQGRGISGATIRAFAGDTRFQATSEARGRALLAALPPGDVRLSASSDGHGTVRAGPVRIRAGAQRQVTIVLTRGVQITGTILDDATGGVVADARVYVSHPGRSDTADPTGADGRFGPIPGGGVGERVFLAVDAKGYAPVLEPVVLHAEQTQDIVLRMKTGEAWTGRVLPPPGRRFDDAQGGQGVVVGYTSDGTAERPPMTTDVDAEGRFTLPPPPDPLPGRRVVLFAEGLGGRAALALRPGILRPDPLVLQLVAGSTVTGTVRDAGGQPLRGVQVRLTPVWDRTGSRRAPDAATSKLLLANERGFEELAGASGDDGAWMIANVSAGTYEVRYRWHGGQHWRAGPLEVGGAAAVSAGSETLGKGLRLAGRVRDGRGAPAEGATIRVASIETARHVHRATADSDGYFALTAMAPGVYSVRAFLGSYEPVATEVTLEADRDDVDLDFEAGAVVEGRVDGPGGLYSGPLSLRLRRPAGGGARPPQTVMVKRGRFRWEEVPSGTWRLDGRVPAGAFAFAADTVSVEAGRITNVTLTLQPPASLAGRIAGRDGPAAGARVQLTDADGGGRRLATTDADGRFVIEGLEAGMWTVSAWGRGGAPTETTVSIDAGARRTIEIKLAPAGRVFVTVRTAQGRPAAGAVVLFRSAAGPLPGTRPDRTDRQGRLDRDGLPVGPMLVLARGADGSRGQMQTSIRAGRRSEVRITLAP